ncbi:JAB domain-containing protein [Fusibacter ferrireducens]|uniref:DNA repair protein n=1 Tax=Fusibacter ferrireducens TaxID=2785058 RepID=A0ABR9ZXB8_9FIRM|nr:JAB domain-containing protein [Fusibacter ferrireducens]MBF4695095.1 DNA repair protein [Fusibacter ferrireducens]
MTRPVKYSDDFFKSLNALTGIPIRKIQAYAKENNPFNILEHPMVVEPTDKQLEKISKLNEFIASYSVLRMEEDQKRIKFASPDDSGQYFLSLLGGMRDRERFMVAFLDNSNSIIETRTVSEGTVNMAIVHPRDILKIAIANDCTSLILSHNHPGGSINPSMEDKALTQRIVDIFHPLNIKVLDHIIVGGTKFSSMAENGYLPNGPQGKAKYDPIQLNGEANEPNEDYEFGEEPDL